MVAAFLAGLLAVLQPGDRRLYQRTGLVGVGQQHLHHLLHRHMVVLGVPAVEIRHHGDAGVAQLRLAGELGLGHVGHADHVAAPAAIELGFRFGGELQPLHREIGAAIDKADAGFRRRIQQMPAQPAAHRMRDRDVGDAALAEEALLAREGAVDELIDQHEGAGFQILAQAAHGADRQDFGDTGTLQRVDIGAVIDAGRAQRMPPPMARQEHDRHPVQSGEQQLVRGLTPRRGHRAPFLVAQPVQIIDTAAADNANHRLCRFSHSIAPHISQASQFGRS